MRGTVSDSMGRPLGAVVTLRNAETNADRSADHQRPGVYRGHPPAGRHLRRRPVPWVSPEARRTGLPLRLGETVDISFPGRPKRCSSRDRRWRPRAAGRCDDVGVGHPPGRRGGGRPAEQRPQHPQLHHADAERRHRAGARTATRSASAASAASTTTSRWTAPTSTIRSSASSAAASGRRSRSISTPCRSSWWCPTAPTRSSGARAAVRQRHHQVGHQRVPRLGALLREVRRALGRLRPYLPERRRRFHPRLPPASVRRHAGRADHARPRLLLRWPTTSRCTRRPSRPTGRARSIRCCCAFVDTAFGGALAGDYGPIAAHQRRQRPDGEARFPPERRSTTRRSSTTTPTRGRRTARSTSTSGAGAPTRSRATSPTRSTAA